MATVLVSDLITKARTILNDKVTDNFSQDDISDLCDGSTTVFRANNMNVLTTTDGAPAAPVVRVNGTVSAIASFNAQSGLITLSSAPAAGTLVYLEYWFALMLNADYIGFAQGGAEFLGLTPLFTLATDDSKLSGPFAEAVVHYMAAQGATKMTNLASWYYQFGAGNKSINKSEIAKAFKVMADTELKKAQQLRDELYTREGARNAPAWGRGHTPYTDYTPPR